MIGSFSNSNAHWRSKVRASPPWLPRCSVCWSLNRTLWMSSRAVQRPAQCGILCRNCCKPLRRAVEIINALNREINLAPTDSRMLQRIALDDAPGSSRQRSTQVSFVPGIDVYRPEFKVRFAPVKRILSDNPRLLYGDSCRLMGSRYDALFG